MRIGNGAKFTPKNHLFNIETQCSVFFFLYIYVHSILYVYD